MVRKQKELNSLKIKGTQFDRRSKLSKEDREQIIYLCSNKKELEITNEDIAKAFNISKCHVYRCSSEARYKEYLERSKLDSKTYRASLSDEELKEKRRKGAESCSNYKNALLDIIDKYSIKSC